MKVNKFVIALSGLEIVIYLFSNAVYGAFLPLSFLILLPFLIFNFTAMELLSEKWSAPVIMFLSVIFLGALDIVTSYQVVNAASVACETNLMVKSVLTNPLNYTILKMTENTFSATIIFALMTMCGKSKFMKNAGYAAGLVLVLFMMVPPINNYVVLNMMA